MYILFSFNICDNYQVKGPVLVNWFTFLKNEIGKNINLLSYLYSSNLNVPDISF